MARIILDGLVWEKKVSKGSQCGLICVPESLVGKRLKVILIPVDPNDSLSVQKEIVINNDSMRKNNSIATKLANKKKKLDEEVAEKKIIDVPAVPKQSNDLEEEDAY
jgi:hypothetical protein